MEYHAEIPTAGFWHELRTRLNDEVIEVRRYRGNMVASAGLDSVRRLPTGH